MNGQVYVSDVGCKVIVLWTGIEEVDEYVLLSTPFNSSHGGTAMMVCKFARRDGGYNPFYTEAQLQEFLRSWKLKDDTMSCLRNRSYQCLSAD